MQGWSTAEAGPGDGLSSYSKAMAFRTDREEGLTCGQVFREMGQIIATHQ